MELPKNESVFDIDINGDTSGKRYEGQFSVRCVLNMGQKHAMELEKTRLMGNHSSPTDELIGYAVLFANLRAKIMDGPEWWKQSIGGSNIMDENVLVAVYNKILDAEVQWKEKVKEMAAPQAPATSPSQTP